MLEFELSYVLLDEIWSESETFCDLLVLCSGVDFAASEDVKLVMLSATLVISARLAFVPLRRGACQGHLALLCSRV